MLRRWIFGIGSEPAWRGFIGVQGAATAAAATFSYAESEAPNIKPARPVTLPSSDLSHTGLLKRSCVDSVESASTFLSHLVDSFEKSIRDYEETMLALSRLYQDSAVALTEDGGDAVATLNTRKEALRRSVHDSELLFTFTKKLMDANAEVCFLVGADFASNQASSRLLAATAVVKEAMEKNATLELEVAAAHKSHIKKVAAALASMENKSEAEATDSASDSEKKMPSVDGPPSIWERQSTENSSAKHSG